MGYSVDVASYSYYLSQRDYADFEGMFDEFGLIEKIKYGIFSDILEKNINKNFNIRNESTNLFNGFSANFINVEK